jgi:hypothetical protein
MSALGHKLPRRLTAAVSDLPPTTDMSRKLGVSACSYYLDAAAAAAFSAATSLFDAAFAISFANVTNSVMSARTTFEIGICPFLMA